METFNQIWRGRILLFIFFFIPMKLSSQDWVEVVDNDRQLIEVNFSSIKRNNSKILFWSRTTYKKDIQYYIDKQIERLRKSGTIENKDRWKNWNSTLSYQEMDCNEESETILTIIHYNKDGSIIVRVDSPKEDRKSYSIAPNSLSYALFFILCSKFTYEVNGKKYKLPIEKAERFLEVFPDAKYVE